MVLRAIETLKETQTVWRTNGGPQKDKGKELGESDGEWSVTVSAIVLCCVIVCGLEVVEQNQKTDSNLLSPPTLYLLRLPTERGKERERGREREGEREGERERGGEGEGEGGRDFMGKGPN